MALHGAIDDATGQVLVLYFTENECTNGYFYNSPSKHKRPKVV
jgi:hypothetical protein